MQVPGSVSRLLKVYQRWARAMPDCTLGAHPRSRAKPLPLPVTCLAVPSLPKERQRIYLQRPSSPPQTMSPATLSATSADGKHQCLVEEWSCSYPEP